MSFISLLQLREQMYRNAGVIRKGKIYLKGEKKPPAGVTVHTGIRGGKYYKGHDKYQKEANQIAYIHFNQRKYSSRY